MHTVFPTEEGELVDYPCYILAKEATVGLYSEMIVEGFLLQKGRLFLVWGILYFFWSDRKTYIS